MKGTRFIQQAIGEKITAKAATSIKNRKLEAGIAKKY